jgi:hypothetical protein
VMRADEVQIMYARLALIKQTAEDSCAPSPVSSVRGEPDADVPMAASPSDAAPGDAAPELSGASASSHTKSGSGAGADGGAEEPARYFEDALGVMPDKNIYRIDWVRAHRSRARCSIAEIAPAEHGVQDDDNTADREGRG